MLSVFCQRFLFKKQSMPTNGKRNGFPFLFLNFSFLQAFPFEGKVSTQLTDEVFLIPATTSPIGEISLDHKGKLHSR